MFRLSEIGNRKCAGPVSRSGRTPEGRVLYKHWNLSSHSDKLALNYPLFDKADSTQSNMNLKTLLCTVLLAGVTSLLAQQRTCHTMGNLERLLEEHPQYQEELDRIEEFTREHVTNPQLGSTPW